MGADVAASPHCPVAVGYQAWEARQSAWAVSRHRDPSRGPGPHSSGVLPALARLPVSPRAPRQGRSPGGSPRQIRNRGSGSRRLRAVAEARFRPRAGKLRPKPPPCLAVPGLASRVCRFAAPGPKPGPARRVWDRNPVRPGGGARTCVPLSAGQVRNRSLAPASWSRTRRSETLGALRSLPLPHPRQGKPAASAWRRLRQPPGPSLDRLAAWWGKKQCRSGCGWEGSRPLPVDRLGHVPRTVMKDDSLQAHFACG